MAKAKKEGHKSYDVDREQFVVIWNSSSTAEEAAKKAGMPIEIAHARATKYRSAGIQMKSMPKRGRGKVLDAAEIARLNGLIERINAGDTSVVEEVLGPLESGKLPIHLQEPGPG